MPRAPTITIPPSIPVDAGLLGGATQLLSHIESLPHDATGVLEFGDLGLILIESRNICWAVARGMRMRLSKSLRQQRSPPLDASYVDGVMRECQETGRPLGEALLADGQISAEGLRAALFSHIAESVARIASSGAPCPAFVPHQAASYDARFVFNTSEVLAALGARRNRALAALARRSLQSSLAVDTRGLAFMRDDCGPVPIAVEGKPALKVPEILDLCDWSCTTFDVSAIFDRSVRVATGTTYSAEAVVTWRTSDAYYVAVCANRASAALMMSRVDAGLESTGEVAG